MSETTKVVLVIMAFIFALVLGFILGDIYGYDAGMHDGKKLKEGKNNGKY